ncbi:MAG: hypothetical protein V1735_00115 [Nanoarchaeota archaeon]
MLDTAVAREAVDYVRTSKDREITRENLEKVLNVPELQLWFAVGPYCTKACPTCMCGCGSDQSAYMTPAVVKKTRRDIDDTHIGKVWFEDGEPFHDIGNLLGMVDVLEGLPVGIATNASFAVSYERASEVLSQLRATGFTVRRQSHRTLGFEVNSCLGPSADEYHGEDSYQHAINLARAYLPLFMYEVATPIHLEQVFRIQYHADYSATLDHAKRDENLISKLVTPLQEQLKGKLVIGPDHFSKPYFIIRTPDGLIWVQMNRIMPFGRGREYLPRPMRHFRTRDVPVANTKENPGITVRHDGELYWGRGQCVVPGKRMGNVLERPLAEMLEETRQSSLWQMFRLLGLRGVLEMVRFTERQTEFSAETGCNLCIDLFSDEERIRRVEQDFDGLLGGNDIIDFILHEKDRLYPEPSENSRES